MCGNRWDVLTWSWVGRVVVVGARGERFLGVRGFFACVVFMVLHGLWSSSVVVRLAGG